MGGRSPSIIVFDVETAEVFCARGVQCIGSHDRGRRISAAATGLVFTKIAAQMLVNWQLMWKRLLPT